MNEFLYKDERPRHITALDQGGPTPILPPTDCRSARWELDPDINTPERAIRFAANMVPDVPGEQNPYFTRAVTNLLEGFSQFAEVQARVHTKPIRSR
jgi:hypothetical protein